MELKVRNSKDNEWGFVEGFKVWRWDNKGYVEATVGVTVDGNFTKPYVRRGGDFIPLSEIEETIGIDKYIKAKKPFYSLLKDCFVVKVRVGMNFITGETDEERSSFEVYTANTRKPHTEDTLPMMKIREVPDKVTELMQVKLMPLLGECGGDREKFLRSRL